MKRFIQSLLLVAFFIGTTIPVWGQTSTQGKEFWVSLVPGQYAQADEASKQKASDSDNKFKPYIAISAQKACDVKISNPKTGWNITVSVSDNEWKEIGKNGEIPIAQWYTPDAMPTSETAYNLGLKVEATEEVSVYCSLRWGFSADATNILPITALQSEYIVQTYEAILQDITFDGSRADEPKTEDNSFNGVQKNSFTILAAEDCVVDIELSASTSGGKSGKIENLSLQQGQVYHVLSAVNKSLSGSRIKARDNKKIAVFAGAPSTRLPNAFSDRDLLYEQLFPIDYWGNNFVVVRSKHKDANRVIITAQENNTTVTIHGQYDPSTSKYEDHTIQKDYTFTLNSGQSYEFEMSAGYADERWHKHRSAFKGITVIDSATYISTSCPCAVLSYDVGNKYVRNDETEVEKNSGGDNCGAPAMTWIAPIEQMLNDVVFGVMGTDETTKHFVSVIVNTSDVPNVTLNNVSLSDKFKPVESNANYSYARITLRETVDGDPNPVYHLQSKYGFIATVYGNGHNESYAYTAGSSAVKRGVNIDGVKFINNMRADEPFCVNNTLRFDPQVSSDVIDKVVWNFGDGTSATTVREDDIIAEHTYSTPGWYDVTALISAHKDCPYSSYPEEEVSFTFRVVEADTIPVGSGHDCIEADSTYKGVKLTADSIQYLLTHSANTTNEDERKNCYDPVEITFMSYGIKTTHRDTINAKDSALVSGVWYYPETVPADSIVTDTLYDSNQYECDSIIYHFLNITTCLDVEIVNDADAQHVCGEKKMDVAYKIRRGEAGNAAVSFDGQLRVAITLDKTTRGESVVVLPTENLVPGKHHADIFIEDVNCKDTITKAYDFTVYYPNTIFARKFNNVLAVYKKGYGGNKLYDFTAYQWYFNDEAIPNATKSIYHVEGKLASGSYYVVLTRADLEALPSCPITINEDELPDYDQSNAPAQKMIRNSRMVIIKDGRTYDVYGQRVE
jgi:hypothetical protein